jgi:phosphonate transport system substrate-binding protein
MKKATTAYLAFVVLMIVSMALAACAPAATPTPTEAPAATEAPVATEAPAATEAPTEAPVTLGTAENPIIMAQAPSATTQELISGGEAVAAKLTEMTGLTIKVVVPNSYAALVEAMGSGNAHIGWLPTFAYMLAKEKGYADVGLAVVRNGSDHYGAQFIANVDSGFTSYYDAKENKNTADAATALKQFEGKKPCWTDPLSVSGYIIPLGFIQKEGVKVTTGAFVQGHPTVVTALYKGGICDFGATYIDARDNKALNEQFKDLKDKVVIIWKTDPIIPNDNVSYAATLPADIKEKINTALVEIASTPEGQELLKNGGFDVGGLEPVDDTFYDEFRVYLQASGIDVTTLYPK